MQGPRTSHIRAFSQFGFLLYTLLRKDNRKRTIVVLIALLTCFIGLGIAAFRGHMLHNALWSG